MEADPPPPRTARLVLVTPDGTLVGSLPPFPVALPWWQDAGAVVEAARRNHGIDVTILRLLGAERERPHGGAVTYLAEIEKPVAAQPWHGRLDNQPLRLPYAEPAGPAADLAWAFSVLDGLGMGPVGKPQQVRSWNLSSIWRIPVAGVTAWLKVVPPFFAHEGAVIAALAGRPVPMLLGCDGARMLMAEAPGEDMDEAGLPALLDMVTTLVGLQLGWLGRTGELLAMGLPDWRGPALGSAIGDVVRRTGNELEGSVRKRLARFVERLPERFAAIEARGLADTLVHGDFHPGNVRGTTDRLTLLDWGDSGVGHPLLDQSAFLDRVPATHVAPIREHWTAAWRTAVPGSDPQSAAALLAPVAAARQAVVYRRFLDNIEPSERVYHRHDPANWLRRTAELIRQEARSG